MNALPLRRLVSTCCLSLVGLSLGAGGCGSNSNGKPQVLSLDQAQTRLFVTHFFAYDGVGPKFFTSLIDKTRIDILWDTRPGQGFVQAVHDARAARGVSRPLVGLYDIGFTSRMDRRGSPPAQVKESWYLHCKRAAAGCTGQLTQQCRCHPLFDLSEFTGVDFHMQNAFIPNVSSLNLNDVTDLSYGQNYYASVVTQRLVAEDYDFLDLDMYSASWPVLAVYSSAKVPYLADAVELDYAGRLAGARDTLALLRNDLPSNVMIGANGGQADESLSRYLPSVEYGPALSADYEQRIQKQQLDASALWNYMLTAKGGKVHPEWWNEVGSRLDMMLADAWMVLPLLASGSGWRSLLWSDVVWQDEMNLGLEAINSGEIVSLGSDGGDAMDSIADLHARYYSIASFLLLQTPRASYSYVSIGYVDQYLFTTPDFPMTAALPPEADIPLGSPVTQASGSIDSLRIDGPWLGFTSDGPLYARQFANGVVLVNPSSDATISLEVPRKFDNQVSFHGFGYLNVDGVVKDFAGHPRRVCTTPVRQVILPPMSGLVFLNGVVDSGDGSPCPAPW